MTWQWNRFVFAGAFLGVFAAGCGGSSVSSGPLNSDPPAHVDTDIEQWKGMSAPAVYAFSLLPSIDLQIEASGSMPDPNCPAHTSSGGTSTYTGGCTDTHGTTFAGSMTVTGGGISGPPSAATYNNWSMTQHQTCMGVDVSNTITANGSVTSSVSGGVTNFTVDVVITGNGISASASNMMSCSTMTAPTNTLAMQYSGSYTSFTVGTMGASHSTWNGSGRVGSSITGVANVSTSNEVLDSNVCQYTPLSGSTTISSNGNTAVITYQGMTTCDMNATATWTLNGAPQGNLTGVQCSVGRAPGAGRGSLLAGLAFAGAFVASVARRKRRRAQS